jgi:hypothetical protein
MSPGLTSNLVTFMETSMLQRFFDNFMVVFIDDISSLYSKTEEEHQCHLRLVLEIELKKSEFCLSEVVFLGRVIN